VNHPIRDRDDYEPRRTAARARAAWELGDPDWADVILNAFLWPDDDRRALQRERGE